MRLNTLIGMINLMFIFLQLGNAQKDTTSIIWNLDRTERIGDYTTCALLKFPDVVETPFGKALHFNGKDQGILINGNPILNAETFTIEVIFKPDSLRDISNTEQRIFHIMKQDYEKRRLLIELRIDKTQQWSLDVFLSSDSSELILYDRKLSHPVNQWYHIALVFNNETAISYVNGKRELTGHFIFLPITDAKISIGVRQTLISFYKGIVKTIKFTARPLKPSEFINF